MHSITRAKRALKALLAERLPAVLAAADAEENDGVDTEPPFVIYTSAKSALDGYPAIQLVTDSAQSTVDSVAQVYEHCVFIGFELAGDTEETLSTQAERYMWAIRQVCRDTLFDNPPQDLGPVVTRTERYVPVSSRPDGLEAPFVTGGYLEAYITTVE